MEGKIGLYKWVVVSLVLSIIMTLFHTSAFVVGVVMLFVVGYEVLKQEVEKSLKVWGFLGSLGIIFVVMLFKLEVFDWVLHFVSNIDLSRVRFKIWHFLIFWRNYMVYGILGLVGFINLVWKSKWRVLVGFVVMVSILLHLAVILRPSGSVYVRYTLISFPFVFIFMGVGLGWVVDRLQVNLLTGWLVFVGLILIVGMGAKNRTLSFCYNCYHSINADVRENPLADYKRFFNKAKPYFDKYPDIALVDAWEDRDVWYLNRKVDAFMIDRGDHRGKKTALGGVFVTSVDELKRFLQKKSKALVVIEGWPSLAGENMQSFVRNNLDFEYRVCDEKLANEGWCLELYSYGVKDEKN